MRFDPAIQDNIINYRYQKQYHLTNKASSGLQSNWIVTFMDSENTKTR